MGSGDGERWFAGGDSRLAVKVSELKKSNTASERVGTTLEVRISTPYVIGQENANTNQAYEDKEEMEQRQV